MIQFDKVYNLVAEENEELPYLLRHGSSVVTLKGAEEVLGVPFETDKGEVDKDFLYQRLEANLEWMMGVKCGHS